MIHERMHKTLRRLPSLDFLQGFEAAGRLLSFTRAAEEIFVTQSALSRQMQALEEALGVPLFERRHRALALTPAGVAFHRDVHRSAWRDRDCGRRGARARRAHRPHAATTVSFASLWIPRLPAFALRGRTPAIRTRLRRRRLVRRRPLVDLGAATSTSPSAISPMRERPTGAVRLFGERMLPVASPQLVRRERHAARTPADLARHVLLHLDDPEGRMPWLDWRAGSPRTGSRG